MMRYSLTPEFRPEQRMKSLSIEEVLSLCSAGERKKPPLEHYFSPTKKEAFIKDYLRFLNSGLMDAKQQGLDTDQYVLFILSFQFVAPLLEIPAEKEFGLFFRILEKWYNVEELDLNLHFSTEHHEKGTMSEQEAINAFRDELEDRYKGIRQVKESVHGRLRKDAIAAIMKWQKDKSIPSLAEAFGRTVVIPSFFNFMDKRMIRFYRGTTQGITYRVAVPEEIES